jgi:hypothetical protein
LESSASCSVELVRIYHEVKSESIPDPLKAQYGGRNMIIGKCSCCGKIKFIFKNKDDGGYDQSMCAKCYENSWKFAEEFHKNNKKTR